jgi:hypothetical protein
MSANFGRYPRRLSDALFWVKYISAIHFWNKKNNCGKEQLDLKVFEF